MISLTAMSEGKIPPSISSNCLPRRSHTSLSDAATPEAKVVRRELAGVPRVEVVGLSKEKVEELFWDTITQVRADLAGVPRK